MARFRITRAAVRDLVNIGLYTRERWGEAKSRRYLGQLDASFRAIANKHDLGRRCDDVRTGYRRYHEGRHVIFYRTAKGDVVEVIRVLHDRMLPELHL